VGLLFLGKQEVVEPTLEVRGAFSVKQNRATLLLACCVFLGKQEVVEPTLEVRDASAGRVGVLTRISPAVCLSML
jgi:hypothetical protein